MAKLDTDESGEVEKDEYRRFVVGRCRLTVLQMHALSVVGTCHPATSARPPDV